MDKTNYIKVHKDDKSVPKLIGINTFRNPIYISCDKAKRRYPEDEPEWLEFFFQDQDYYYFPRNSIPTPGDIHRNNFRKLNLTSSFKARNEDQKTLIESVVMYLDTDSEIRDGIVTSPTGSGKTVMACEIAHRLNMPTLIVTHKDSLSQQFNDSINLLFGGKARIGKVKGKHFDTGKDFDFVLASATSLATKEYSDDFYKSFGFIVYDEAHRYGAPKLWNKVLGHFHAKNRMGITATMRRNDNLLPVIHNHLGDFIYKSKVSTMQATVYQITIIPKDYKGLKNYTKQEQIWLVNNKYAKDPNIQEKVTNLAIRMQEKGRYTMIMCQQVEQVEAYAKRLAKYKPAVLHGSKHKLEPEDNRRLVITNFQTSKEGLDIPELDSLILASPVSDVEQIIGRILRKPTPHEKLVIDVVLAGSYMSASMASKRMKHYISAGHKIGELV